MERSTSIGPMTMNKKGQWVPAIPEPYYSLVGFSCDCGAKFWTRKGYLGHYALEHILMLDCY